MSENQGNVENLNKEIENAFASKAQKAASKKQKKQKITIAVSRRKNAVARAYLKEGKGKIRINRIIIDKVSPWYVRSIIEDPIRISSIAGNLAKNYDIYVNVKGGGIMGQAQAARSAIAKALVEATKSSALKEVYLNYDRYLIVDDPRRVEPKKFLGPKARARFQTSYR
ncbi:MAG: 30S ribosomal protein S9 [Candidatus Micrarchaeaceae archaeon]